MNLITSFFVVHIFLLVAVFDVYFRTPITYGIEPVENTCGPLAKRVILFVGDGLRSDLFFGGDGSGKVYNPFLRQMMKDGASWGISHTHLPTESRPGHVALCAGFYEDPSAVFKGWKENLVPFDSVFNRSTATFSWGSPDIVPIFSHRRNNPNIFWHSYSHSLQDFSGKNGTAAYLNYWVLDKFNETIQASYFNNTLKQLINQDGIIYFFHLLGIDVAGHARKPHSDYYKDNIRITDKIVQKLVTMIDNYYGDSDTAYIFTSDHGMTDWGSHGAGSESETSTPLLAWGAGIKRSECSSSDLKPNNYEQSTCRKDVEQADVAVLISVLLGQSIPVNSVGVAPLDYLELNDKQKLRTLLLNGKQLLKQFRKKEIDVKSSMFPLFFIPYSDLQPQKQKFLLDKINLFITANNYTVAMRYINFLINYSLRGTYYYHTYFQYFKLFLMTLIFLGEIFFILSKLLPYVMYSRTEFGPYPEEIGSPLDSVTKKLVLTAVFIITSLTLPVEFLFYLLVLTPLWLHVWANSYWIPVCIRVLKHKRAMIFGLIYICGIQMIFWSFFYRWVLIFGLVVFTAWSFLDQRTTKFGSNIRVLWSMSSISLVIFPLLPTVGTEKNIYLVLECGMIWFILGSVFIYMFTRNPNISSIDWCFVAKLILVIPTIWNIYQIDSSFTSGEGLHIINQLFSFFFLIAYFSLMLIGSDNVIPRYVSIAYSLGMSFLLFCSSHESFFELAMTCHLGLWMTIEITMNAYFRAEICNMKILTSRCERKIILLDDVRRCFFYLYYIVFSFFGIGNIDSLNSFDLTWVRGFVTVFSPFIMTGLILLKTLIPFILVTCAFRFIVINTKGIISAMFLIVLIFCDLLCLQFLFCIQNEGSWLDIGKSISHYVIVQVTTLVLTILYGLTGYIIGVPSKKPNKNVLPFSKHN